MPIANYPNGFSGGVQISGFPVLNVYATSQGPTSPSTSGVWYVDSGTGLDGNKGDTWLSPLATIARAFAKAKAYDIILVKSGHTELVSSATSAAWNVKGVQVIGMGIGGTRPTITLDTATTSTITVSADAITATNLVFVANFAAVAGCFTLTTTKGFTLNRCEFRDTDATHNFIAIVLTSATLNANDGLLITNCRSFLAATSGAVKFVSFLGTHDRVQIDNNYYASPTTGTGAVFPIATGKILTNFLLLGNMFNLVNASGTSTGYLITTNGTTNSGFIDGNRDWSAPTTPVPCTTSSGFVWGGGNLHSDQADVQGYAIPAADS